MKLYRITAAILFLYCLTGTAAAQQARFDEANEYLQQQEYRQAINLYSSIADEGYESGALWLNSGIAYTHLDSLGIAKYYFLKAQKYPETRQAAENALEYVNERFPQRSAVLPPLPWNQFFNSLSDRYGSTKIALISMLFFYLGTGLIVWAWFRVDFKKFMSYTGFGALGIALLLFLTAAYIQYLDNRFSTGVLIDRQATVYEQPEDDAIIVSRAYEGYTMRVDFTRSEETPGWKYVRLENGMFGWIDDESLKIL